MIDAAASPDRSPPRLAWAARALDLLAARPRLAVVIAAVLPFLLTLDDPPVLHDGWVALDDPLTHSLRAAGRIFHELSGYAGDPSVRGPYRPLTTLTYALGWAVHGRWTPGYHAVNLALHAAASLLVLALARRLARAAASARAERIAVLAALLFALHPAHVEAVATIFGRSGPLAACFAIGALLLALRWREARLALPAAVGVLVPGVLSDEVALLTPALFGLVAIAVPGAAGLAARPGLRGDAERRALREAALVGAALCLAVIPYLVGRHAAALAPASAARWFPVGTPAAHVALTLSRVLGEYLRILVFPSFLGGDYAYAARIGTLTESNPGFSAATLAWVVTFAGAVALLVRRRAPLVALGLLWTFAALLPAMHLVPIGVLLAERLLYLPSVGFCLAAGAALAALGPAPSAPVVDGDEESPLAWAQAHRPAVAAAIALGALALLAGRSFARSLDWRSSLAFWESELAKAPAEPVVNDNVAVEYVARGDHARAVERLKVALAVQPDYWRAHVDLGVAYQGLADPERARAEYLAAAQLAPSATGPLYHLALLFRDQDQLGAALAVIRDARRLGPEEARLARLEGDLLLRLGEIAGGRAALTRALALDPADDEAKALLAAASRGAGTAAP